MKKILLIINLFIMISKTLGNNNINVFNDEFVLENPEIIHEKDSSSLIFKLELNKQKTFYMNAWMLCAELDSIGSNHFIEYNISINGSKMKETLKAQQQGWHEAMYVKDQRPIPLNLSAGKNIICISAPNPIIPEIEKIFLRQNINKPTLLTNLSKYDIFLNRIKEKQKSINYITNNEPGHILPNPRSNYYHHLDVPVKYTVYKRFHFNKGDKVNIVSWKSNYDVHFDFIMDIFSTSSPISYSWSIKNNDVGDAILYQHNIPFSDDYIVRVRSVEQAQEGIVNLSVSTSSEYYTYNNCPVTSTYFIHNINSSTTYNYFTCNTDIDTQLLIESDENPSKIISFNDNYNLQNGDYNWGKNARINESIPLPIKGIHISSSNTTSPEGTCDLYIMCQNYNNTLTIFPLLKDDDAIMSGSATGESNVPKSYNCASWAGGISDSWIWPPYDSVLYNPGLITTVEKSLEAFDYYFSDTNRYGGATAYTRDGATEENAAIALWYNPIAASGYGAFTHVSVRGRANNNPHGYDWESKLGECERIFHPKNALTNDTNGFGYGHILYYYRPIDSEISYNSLEESVSEGKTIIETIELSNEEKNLLNKLQSQLNTNEESVLEDKYNKWTSTWERPEIKLQSNPQKYAESKEYFEFIEYCEKLGRRSWPFIFQKFINGDFFAINAIKTLTKDELFFKDALISLSKKKNLSDIVIFHTKRSEIIKIIKNYLKGNITKSLMQPFSENEGITYSNNTDFKIIDNHQRISFELPSDATTSVYIKDLNNNIIGLPLKETNIKKGKHIINLNIPKYYKGFCLIILRINGNLNVKKILIN